MKTIRKTVSVRPQPSELPARRAIGQWAFPYLLVLPVVVIVGVVLVAPLIFNLIASLMSWRFVNIDEATFVGLDNFRFLLFENADFWPSLRFTLLFVAVTLSLELVIGTASAMLIFQIGRGRGIITGLVLLPFMVAPLATGLIWRLLFAPDVSVVNYALESIGLSSVLWLGQSTPAFWAIIIAEVWRSAPLVTLLVLAGLSAMPMDVFAAARVDGANSWQTFHLITVPFLRPTFAVIIIFQSILKLRLFDLAWILTSGGPGNATLPLGILLQRTYFRYLDPGAAAALGVALLLVGALVALVVLKTIYREVDYS